MERKGHARHAALPGKHLRVGVGAGLAQRLLQLSDAVLLVASGAARRVPGGRHRVGRVAAHTVGARRFAVLIQLACLGCALRLEMKIVVTQTAWHSWVQRLSNGVETVLVRDKEVND